MITKTLKVPNKLSELTLGQYQVFSKILEGDPDVDFMQKKTIEIFCGVDLNNVSKFKYSSIVNVIDIINKMFEQKPKLIDQFKLNGVEYGFIPKLDDMTFGEFVDLDVLMNDWDTMDQAMSILYRKIKSKKDGKYIIEKYNSEKTHSFKNMPLDVALSSIFFFKNLNKELVNHILLYLEKEMQQLPVDQRQNLQKILDGGGHFMQLLKVD
jgi:hypothetical protein|tara:strand:- start:227 stop:856 length:630 start_codon:yes stop_codon:yes gene_type:complete